MSMVVYWLNIDIMVRIMVSVMMSINMVDIMVYVMVYVMVHVVVSIMVSIVVSVVMSMSLVVGWLGNYWSAVIISVMVGVSRWGNLMLFTVSVMFCVLAIVMVSWSMIGMDWLGVSVLVYIDDWVVMVGVWMVWVTGWVSVHSLVFVIDSLVVDGLNIVGDVFFKVVMNGLMRSSHIVLGHVVVVVTSVSVVVVDILELNLMMVFTIFICSVINLMLSLMIDILVGDRVVFSFMSLNMWLDFMDSCLLKRSMV